MGIVLFGYYFSGMLASYSYRSYNESIMSSIHSILSTPERGHKVIAFTLFVLFRYLSFSHMPFSSLSKSIGTIQLGTYLPGVWSQEFGKISYLKNKKIPNNNKVIIKQATSFFPQE